MKAPDLAPLGGLEAGLLAQLAPGTVEGVLRKRDAALGDLPRPLVERVAVLTYERDAIVVVNRHHADGKTLEVDDPVDPGPAVGTANVVVPDGDPAVVVRRPAGRATPR